MPNSVAISGGSPVRVRVNAGPPGVPGQDGASSESDVAGWVGTDGDLDDALGTTYGKGKFAEADAVLYVSVDGDDANDGLSPGKALASIQTAIDTLADLDLRGEVRVGAGEFTEYITLRDNVSITGRGSYATTIKAPVGGSEAGLVQLAVGPVSGANLKGLRLEGSGNAGQHGIYAVSQASVAAPYHGGWWYSTITDVSVVDFLGRPIWLRGGGTSMLLPHQFLEFHLVRAFTTVAANKEALVLSGQVGQVNFHGCEFDGNDTAPFGDTMTVPNIWITKELDASSAYVSAIVPYAITFHTQTIQGGHTAALIQYGAAGITFVNPHLEGFKYGFRVTNSSDVVLVSPSFSNVTDYWGKVTDNGHLKVTAPSGGGTRNQTFIADGNLLSTVIADAQTSDTGDETEGVTKQVSVSGGGVVDLGPNRSVICNTSATVITNLEAAVAPGQSIFIKAFSGALKFAEGSGLHLGGIGSFTLLSGAVAHFVRMDILSSWVLVGAPQGNMAWTQISSFVNSWAAVSGFPVNVRLTPDGGHIEFAGQLQSGSANTVAFTLAAAFRPTTKKTLTSYSIGNGGGRGIEIDTNGDVKVMSGVTAPISLDGLRFPIDI